MAAINIITPRYGTIEVLNSSLSNYRVKYVPPPDAAGGAVEFNGFKVFCQACHQYLYTTSPDENPATFDIQHLLDTGHPGNFDISADTSAEVEFLVTTRPDDPNMGSTTPVDEWIPTQVGHYVRYTIKATPRKGFKFVKWVSSTGNEFTTASVSFSIKLDYGDTDYRDYTAYFAPEDYAYQVRPRYVVTDDGVPVADGGTNRRASGFRYNERNVVDVERRTSLSYGGVLYDSSGAVAYQGTNNFAYLHGTPYKYTAQQQVTVTLEIVDQALWDLLGLRLLGWLVSLGYVDSVAVQYELPAAGNSVTLTLPPHGRDYYYTYTPTIYAIIATSEVHRMTFSCAPPAAAELYMLLDSGTGSIVSSRRGDDQIGYCAAGSALRLQVMSILQNRGLIHGWSEQLSDVTGTAGSIASKSYTMPDHDARVTVYVCSHRLLYDTSSDKLIHGGSGQLLYDCNVPTGTTVYE